MSAINTAGSVLGASPAGKIEICFGLFEPAAGVNFMPGKRFSLVEGKLLSEHGTFGKATYRTMTVNTPQELSAALRGAPPGSFITQGVADVADLTAVVATAQLEKSPGAITRTNAHIHEADGGALVTIDYDPPEYPNLAPAKMPLPRDQITCIAGGPVFMLDRPSTSAFIADAATGEVLCGERGRHINLAVEHGSKREEQLDRLHQRAVLNGWYWPKITSQGSVSVVTVVDLAMKRRVQPQFCAPILARGLVRAKTNGVLVDGGYLDIPPLTAPEKNEYERRVAEMMKREDVIAQAAANAAEHAKALGARGMSPESVKAAMGASTLRGDVPLQLRLKGSSGALRVTVKDVLNDPEKYHEATALDPVAFIEPAYSTNWCCKLYLLNQTSGPMIHSQAHGGRDFRLMNEARDDFSAGHKPKFGDAGSFITSATSIEMEPVIWLWKYRLARGMFHLLGGAPGTGKSTLAFKIAAIISSGGTFPDGQRAPKGRVLIWSGEDSYANTIKPRLAAAGADMDNIGFLNGGKEITKGEKIEFDPALHMQTLFDDLKSEAIMPLMVIIDPIVSATKGDNHKNNEVRRDLQKFVDMLMALGIVGLGITHFTKGTEGKNPKDRFNGSVAYIALARVGFCSVQQRDAQNDYNFIIAKSNIGPEGGGHRYHIDGAEVKTPAGKTIETSQVVWDETLTGDAGMLIEKAEGNRGRKPDQLNAACDLLRQLLAKGAVPKREIEEAMEDAGVSGATMRRAAERVRVKSERIDPKDNRSPYQWRLDFADFDEP